MAWDVGKLTPLRRNAFVFGKGEQKGEIHNHALFFGSGAGHR